MAQRSHPRKLCARAAICLRKASKFQCGVYHQTARAFGGAALRLYLNQCRVGVGFSRFPFEIARRTRAVAGMGWDGDFRGAVRLARRLAEAAAAFALCALVANCSSSSKLTSRVDPRYGVAASPRVVEQIGRASCRERV